VLHLLQTVNHGYASFCPLGPVSEFFWEFEKGQGTSIGGGRR
jgi:hypothetical protein